MGSCVSKDRPNKVEPVNEGSPVEAHMIRSHDKLKQVLGSPRDNPSMLSCRAHGIFWKE